MLAAFRHTSFRAEVVTRALVDPSAFGTDFVERALALGPSAAEIGFDAVRYQTALVSPSAAPVSLLWGDQDSLIPWPKARRLAARLKAPLVAIPGCGHVPQMQDPGAFVDGLLQLLAK